MKNIIFYFSGTGNSLHIAREIARELGDTQIEAIGSGTGRFDELPFERIGFVFPVYYWSLPDPVRRFVETLKFDDSHYVFGVATYAAAAGTALAQLGSAVSGSGGQLRAGFGVNMPGNYIVKYGAFPLPLQKLMLRGARKKVRRIAGLIAEKKTLPVPAGSRMARNLEQTNAESLKSFPASGLCFHATDACTGCGTCARVCPAGNIAMIEGRPLWGAACEQCVACIQWCPAQAVEYADKTAKRKRYRHPQVTLKEIMSAARKAQ